jgi:hypothetical protein
MIFDKAAQEAFKESAKIYLDSWNEKANAFHCQQVNGSTICRWHEGRDDVRFTSMLSVRDRPQHGLEFVVKQRMQFPVTTDRQDLKEYTARIGYLPNEGCEEWDEKTPNGTIKGATCAEHWRWDAHKLAQFKTPAEIGDFMAHDIGMWRQTIDWHLFEDVDPDDIDQDDD